MTHKSACPATVPHSDRVFCESNPKYVYLMESSGRWKIGVSFNPSDRAKKLVQSEPSLRIIHEILAGSGFWLERTLHRAFAAKWTAGEWFALEPMDVAVIQAIGPCPCPCLLPPGLVACFLKKTPAIPGRNFSRLARLRSIVSELTSTAQFAVWDGIPAVPELQVLLNGAAGKLRKAITVFQRACRPG